MGVVWFLKPALPCGNPVNHLDYPLSRREKMRRFITTLNQMWKRFLPESPMVIIATVLATAILLISAGRFSKDIKIVDNGGTIEVSTYRAKVGDALKGANIEVGRDDKILPAIESVVTDNMTIVVKRAVPIKVAVDGKELQINSAEEVVSDMLKAEGIVLNEKDKISPELTASITEDLSIKITRVEEKLITSTEKIPYRTTSKQDSNLKKGSTKVLTDGEDGEKEVTTKITYEDGKEVSRESVGEEIKKAAVNKIVAVGTLNWFTPSRSGATIYYTNKIRMKATSYTSNFQCTGKNPGDRGFGITATGTKAKRVADGYSTVAVDPDFIPLGTKLYIEGYGYAIAEDVGGGVNGKIIDLYFEPGTNEFRQWFTHYANVYVVK